MDKEDKLRKIVVAVIINKQKKILMCEHIWIDGAWQFPQGGIEKGEKEEETLFRELREELGNEKFEIISKYPDKINYYFPKHIKHGEKYIGCKQTFFLVEFLGQDKDIDFNKQEKPEFKSFKWVNLGEPEKTVIYFKKISYLKVMQYFKDKIKNH